MAPQQPRAVNVSVGVMNRPKGHVARGSGSPPTPDISLGRGEPPLRASGLARRNNGAKTHQIKRPPTRATAAASRFRLLFRAFDSNEVVVCEAFPDLSNFLVFR
jgi:hypothetical protein